jgi:accessory colonization factor AcfC
LVTITIIKSIICQRPLNVTIYIVIFVLFLFFIHQWNITHQVYGLYFGNNIVINSGNVSSSFTKGQMSSVERGYPYVVWVDKNNTIYFGASHENGTKFSSPIALSSNNTLAFSPQIVATEKGGVYVVWVDKNNATGDSNIVFRGSNDNGKSFDRSVRLNRNASPNQTSVASYPQIVATEKGGVYVVWVDKNNATGDSNIVFRGSNDSGKSFDSSVRLNRNPNQISLSFSPQIAASENGSIFVTWPENTLQFKEILDGGNIFGRTVSLNNHVVLPLSAQIVSAENGNIYLAWAEKTDGLNNDAVLMFKRISQYYFDRR